MGILRRASGGRKMNYKDWYFEDYNGQDTKGFDFIGIMGQEPIPLTNPEEQVKEFTRLYGERIIRIYKSAGAEEVIAD